MNVYICSAARTAIGTYGGTLRDVHSSELGTAAAKAAIERAGVDKEAIDEVLFGQVLQGGVGQNVARQVCLKSGLPITTPAMTLNKVCASSMRAISLGTQIIRSGENKMMLVGGCESMSGAPYISRDTRWGARMGDKKLVDMMVYDGVFDVFNQYHMGITAENVAEKYGITREMQDEFAASSQQKCEAARKAGRFKDEIVPVPIKVKKETVLFDTDEFPRDGVTAEGIAKLRPAFKEGGTVTAANASGINDGAAAIVVMSADKAKELGIKPMAKWVAGATAGVDPSIMGIGPAFSTKKLFDKTGLTIDQMDLIEANEAFAAQSLAVGIELGWDASKVNVNGGALALGHPVGASGCRILVTLLHEMKKRGSKLGLATLCIGGGMGCSTVVENIQ